MLALHIKDKLYRIRHVCNLTTHMLQHMNTSDAKSHVLERSSQHTLDISMDEL